MLEAHLHNFLWLGGGACGGKTTIANLLAEKHGFVPYHPEDHYDEHKKLASPQDHPAMLKPFVGWEWYFNRPLEEYVSAILEIDRERFEMVVPDLMNMSEESTAVVDGHMLDPLLLKRVTTYNKAAFLYADAPTIRETFFARQDKQGLLKVINGLKDPEATREHVLDVVCELSRRKISQVESSGMKSFIRNLATPIGDTVRRLEDHFGLC